MSFLFEYGSFCLFLFEFRGSLVAARLDHRVNRSERLRRRARALLHGCLWRLLPEVRPAVGDDLELILVVGREHHLRLNDSLESLAPLLPQLDVCGRGRRRVLVIVLVKVARTNLRKRRVDLVEAQSLSEVLGVEACGAAVSTGEERIDLRPLIPHDVVQVARGTAATRVLDALDRQQELDALLLRLPRVGGPARGLGLRRRLRRLVREEPEVLLVRATEVRVHAAADSLGDARAPVREQGLARLVVQRGLSLHVRVEDLIGGHLAR